MARRLRSSEGEALLVSFKDSLKRHLEAVDLGVGLEQAPELDQLTSLLTQARELYRGAPDEVLDDIYVLECYVRMFGEYGYLWHQIANSNFSESWRTVQNVFNIIRQIKRFSTIDVSAIEDQLYALETLYPYKIFFSMGAVVDYFECSICGHDIDSFECAHRGGELYRGQMAVAIARNIVQLDHVAMVERPVDKRCVITYKNDAPQFSVVRYIANLLSTRSLSVLCFAGAVWGKGIVQNQQHIEMGRNERCYCDSGKKYKKCCIGKASVEQDHVQIMRGLPILPRAVA
ncbi:MAG: SEC-C domain-containing protein [Gammaproteobacteria bacterium]|nr:SEC-C domain-containing protein [Gammaproteobacteria bacterium]